MMCIHPDKHIRQIDTVTHYLLWQLFNSGLTPNHANRVVCSTTSSSNLLHLKLVPVVIYLVPVLRFVRYA